jgi:hypothetical protein
MHLGDGNAVNERRARVKAFRQPKPRMTTRGPSETVYEAPTAKNGGRCHCGVC